MALEYIYIYIYIFKVQGRWSGKRNERNGRAVDATCHWFARPGHIFDCGYELCNLLSSYLVLSYFIHVKVYPLVVIQPDGGLYVRMAETCSWVS